MISSAVMDMSLRHVTIDAIQLENAKEFFDFAQLVLRQRPNAVEKMTLRFAGV
ncbi:hypothetical protein NBRC116594_33960 [Shimia sp. NS0008-38b]